MEYLAPAVIVVSFNLYVVSSPRPNIAFLFIVNMYRSGISYSKNNSFFTSVKTWK